MRINVTGTGNADGYIDVTVNGINVTATLYMRKNAGTVGSTGTISGTLTVGNSTQNISRYGSWAVNTYYAVGTVTGTITGTGTVSTRVANTGTALAGTYTGSGTVTTISAPTINSLTLGSKTINSITCNFSVNRADTFYYRIDGRDWQRGSNNITNGTFTIQNLTPNTSYKIYFLARNWINESAGTYQDASSDITINTYDIAKITEVPNISIGASHIIKWTNPSVASTSLKLCKTDNSQIIDYGTVTGTNKSVTPTASTIYALTPNSNTYTARYIITTTANGASYIDYKDFTFTVTNSNPIIIGTLTYKDSNTTTSAITADDKRIVRNKSTLQFTFGSATPQNSATISKYEVECNGVTKSSTTAGTLDFGIVNLTYNTKAILKVTDSRGNTDSKEITVIIDDWQLPSAIISLARLNNYEDTTYLKVDGNFSSVNGKNQMTIKYKYKRTDQTNYTELITIQDNVQETIILNKEYSWNFVVVVSDSFGSMSYELTLAIGMPMIFYDTVLLSVGVNGFPTHKKSFEVFGNMYVNDKEMLDYEVIDTW